MGCGQSLEVSVITPAGTATPGWAGKKYEGNHRQTLHGDWMTKTKAILNLKLVCG